MSTRTPGPRVAGPPGPTVQIWVFPPLIAWVERQGVDATPIRALPGLQHLDDPDARVPESAADRAWEMAASLTQDPAAGIHVAASLARGALDLVEYALRASASLAEGFRRLARYGPLFSDRVTVETAAAKSGVVFAVRDTGHTGLHPARAEFGLALALKLARESTGVDISPVEVRFGHAAPAESSEHERYFRAPIRFSAGANAMTISATDAARLLVDADSALVQIVQRRLDRALRSQPGVDAGPHLASKVRELLFAHLGRTAPAPETIARALAVSRRILSRRLGIEGTSYRTLLDQVRRETAEHLLQDPTLSIGEIAFFLHYSEPAAFHRAFRRWTGQTPQAFRHAPA